MKNKKGFYLFFEAMLAIIIVAIMLSQVKPLAADGTGGVATVQKMHDILLIWTRERSFSPHELEKDFRTVFPNRSGIIEIEEQTKLVIGHSQNNTKAVTEEIRFLDGNMELKKIKLTLFN